MSEASRRSIAIVAGVLLLSLLVRVVGMLVVPIETPTQDAARYDMAARRILAGRGFAYPLERSTASPATGARFESFLRTRTNAFTMPGFAYWLAALWSVTGQGEGRWLVARLANCLLTTLSLLLLYLIAVRVTDRRAAMATLVLAALFPPLIAVSAFLLTESLFVALLLAWVLVTLVALERRTWTLFAASGGVLGLLTLVRPTALLWVAFVAVWMAAGRRYSIRSLAVTAAVTAAAFALVMSPWWIRNAVRYGHPVWLTTSGSNTLAVATSPGYRFGGRPGVQWPRGVTDDEELGRYWSALARAQATDIVRGGIAAYAGRRARLTRYAALHPWPSPSERIPWALTATTWYWYGVLALALAGLVARRRRSLLWLVVAMGAAVFLVHAATLMLDRYLHPVLWIVMVPAGAGLVAGIELLARRRSSGLRPAARVP